MHFRHLGRLLDNVGRRHDLGLPKRVLRTSAAAGKCIRLPICSLDFRDLELPRNLQNPSLPFESVPKSLCSPITRSSESSGGFAQRIALEAKIAKQVLPTKMNHEVKPKTNWVVPPNRQSHKTIARIRWQRELPRTGRLETELKCRGCLLNGADGGQKQRSVTKGYKRHEHSDCRRRLTK